MGANYPGVDAGTDAERPTFDEVARGYDPRQVEEYLATLWRYASQVTARAAAAEAALEGERRRHDAESCLPEPLSAQAGGRIGIMLAVAQQEADEIVAGARGIAERALKEAIEDAAANHPIVREAREQADKLVLDAVEESRHRAQLQQDNLEKRIAQASGNLETLRHQQGEVLGALLRLRSLMNADEIDRAVTDLARAGTGTGGRDAEQPEMFRPRTSTHEQTETKTKQNVTSGGFFSRPPASADTSVPRYPKDDDIIDAEIVEE